MGKCGDCKFFGRVVDESRSPSGVCCYNPPGKYAVQKRTEQTVGDTAWFSLTVVESPFPGVWPTDHCRLFEPASRVDPPNPPAPETGIDDDLEEAWQAMHRSPGRTPVSDVVRAGMEKAKHEAEAAPPTLVVVNPAATAPGSYADLGRLAGAEQPRAEDSP